MGLTILGTIIAFGAFTLALSHIVALRNDQFYQHDSLPDCEKDRP